MKFTADFVTANVPNWERWLAEFKGKPVHMLEIGSFEGRSACWFLEHILTHPEARITCVDTFKAGQDMAEYPGLLEVFQENLWPWKHKMTVVIGRSAEVLEPLTDLFDLIYVDGSHQAADVLLDLVLCWKLLKPKGVMIMDDYEWPVDPNPANRPKFAIDSFMGTNAGQFELIFKGYQMVLRKICGA